MSSFNTVPTKDKATPNGTQGVPSKLGVIGESFHGQENCDGNKRLPNIVESAESTGGTNIHDLSSVSIPPSSSPSTRDAQVKIIEERSRKRGRTDGKKEENVDEDGDTVFCKAG